MSQIPRKVTVNIIDETLQRDQDRKHRPHLGGSLIGHRCMRHIWYSFRWYASEEFNGRMLRLFDRGHEEEGRFNKFLTQAGIKVMHSKPEPQKRYSMIGSHFSCEIDGQALNVPEAPEKLHNLEYKTYSHKSFLKLLEMNEKSYMSLRDEIPFQCDTRNNKHQHYAQMIVGMGMARLNGEDVERCLYLGVNKNDDALVQERVAFKQEAFDKLVDKADAIVFATMPPPKLHESGSWHECQYCKFKEICHFDGKPEMNCRTCSNSIAQHDGTWKCKKWDKVIPLEEQRKAHHCHDDA